MVGLVTVVGVINLVGWLIGGVMLMFYTFYPVLYTLYPVLYTLAHNGPALDIEPLLGVVEVILHQRHGRATTARLNGNDHTRIPCISLDAMWCGVVGCGGMR